MSCRNHILNHIVVPEVHNRSLTVAIISGGIQISATRVQLLLHRSHCSGTIFHQVVFHHGLSICPLFQFCLKYSQLILNFQWLILVLIAIFCNFMLKDMQETLWEKICWIYQASYSGGKDGAASRSLSSLRLICQRLMP